jgi:uncharacterized protein
MKVVAVSDSHGNRGLLREAVLQALRGAPVDVFVHCGDGARDVEAVEPILRDANPAVRLYVVRGNCDAGAFQYQALELFEAGGLRMMATHGHAYGVKNGYGELASAAKDHGAKIVFFGHTHLPLLEAVHGVYLVNPGAVCGRPDSGVAYAQVLSEAGGRFRADLMNRLA